MLPVPARSTSFERPAQAFRPVPFWWWVGDALTVERLTWQLDQLREKGIFNAIISYPHHSDGTLAEEIRRCFRRPGGTCSG